MPKWTEDTATECGHTVFIHEDWDGPPKRCKSCKEANKEKWYEKRCEAKDCFNDIKCNKDWEHEPKYCKDCKNKFQDVNLSCMICNNSFIWSAGSQRKAEENGWEQPKRCHECREFIKKTSPTEINCYFCPEKIQWDGFKQLMERHKDWKRPIVCSKCKADRELLIVGAVAEFDEKIYVKDEETGQGLLEMIFEPGFEVEKAAVVYSFVTKKRIACITIENVGILGQRKAVTYHLTSNQSDRLVRKSDSSGPERFTKIESAKIFSGPSAINEKKYGPDTETIKTKLEREPQTLLELLFSKPDKKTAVSEKGYDKMKHTRIEKTSDSQKVYYKKDSE